MLQAQDLIGEIGILAAVVHPQLVPGSARSPAAGAAKVGEMLAHAVRHQELGIFGPTVAAFGEPDLLLTKRLAVRGTGILLVRRAEADVAVDDDQAWRAAVGVCCV